MRCRRLQYCGPIAPGWNYRPLGNLAGMHLAGGVHDAFHEWTLEAIVQSRLSSAKLLAVISRNNTMEEVKAVENETLLEFDSLRVGYGIGDQNNYRGLLIQDLAGFEDVAECGLLDCHQVGSRIRLTWTQSTDEDFEAYKLYWDEGGGGDPTTLLETIYDRNETEYITVSELAAGSYKFALALIDDLGNESAKGSTETVTLNPPPDEPTVESAYNQTTRKLELTITTSENVVVLSNWLAGYPDLLRYAHGLHKYPVIHVAGTSYTSRVLFPGVWEFRVYAVTDAGVYSSATPIRFELVMSGADLVEKASVDDVPALEVYQKADAKLQLIWSPETPDDGAADIWESADGETWSNADTTEDDEFEYSGIDGTEVYLKIRFISDAGATGNWSNVVMATPDGAAPTGSTALEGEIL